MISAGVEPCRRSHLPMDILLPLFGHTTIECINGQKMVLTKLRPLYPSIVGGDDCLFIKSAHRSHQRCHNGGNSPPIIIGTYHRMYHRPNKVYLWSFVRYLPSSFPLFDRRRTMIVWHLHRCRPPIEDWGECTTEGCWDAYCTTTSNSNSHIVESLYGTTGVQSSAEYIQIEYMYDV